MKSLVIYLVSLLAATPLAATTVPTHTLTETAPLELSGQLANDSSVAFHALELSGKAAARVRFETFSYAGGTLASGRTVARGGFDPILSLFDANGVFVDFNDDNRAPTRWDMANGGPGDSLLELVLAPGRYTLAVSQFANFPDYLVTGNYSESDPAFSARFGCSNGHFCDATALNRSPDYAVEVSVAPVPLPASFLLLLSALAVPVAFARSRA